MADVKPLDETVPGGRYIVNDVEVDCNGEPITGRASEAASDDPLAFLSAEQRTALAQAGFPGPAEMRRASDDDLDAVAGIGTATVDRIRAAVGREP